MLIILWFFWKRMSKNIKISSRNFSMVRPFFCLYIYIFFFYRTSVITERQEIIKIVLFVPIIVYLIINEIKIINLLLFYKDFKL